MRDLTRRELLGSVIVGAAAGLLRPAVAAASSEGLEPDGALRLPLYPGAIPNALDAPDEESTRDPKEKWVYRQNVSRPELTVFLPRASAPTPAVVICPGGSYKGVSIDKEGYSVARAFNRFGVAGIVLKYRTPSSRHMKVQHLGALQDAQQALHVVHQHASEWRIDTKRIGIVGFSAGGHLAASTSTLFAQPVLAEHSAAQVRPAFSVLVYPVISMRDELTHQVSREQLLGATPTPELIARFSANEAVTDATPPAFLMHAADDTAVLVGNSLRYFEALRARDISAQLFVYARGGHGFGLVNPTTSDRWIDGVQHWMASEGWIEGGASEG